MGVDSGGGHGQGRWRFTDQVGGQGRWTGVGRGGGQGVDRGGGGLQNRWVGKGGGVGQWRQSEERGMFQLYGVIADQFYWQV